MDTLLLAQMVRPRCPACGEDLDWYGGRLLLALEDGRRLLAQLDPGGWLSVDELADGQAWYCAGCIEWGLIA